MLLHCAAHSHTKRFVYGLEAFSFHTELYSPLAHFATMGISISLKKTHHGVSKVGKNSEALRLHTFYLCIRELQIGVDRFALLRCFAGLYLCITASYFDQAVAYWLQQLYSSIVASPVILHHSLAQRYADCRSYLMLLVVPWLSVNG